VLAGEASWAEVDRALDERAEFLARFAAEQRVQTNEVGRAWALLPALLSLGAPQVELLELGCSAGLLLLLDRYAYRYRSGGWGEGSLLLSGDDRGGPPAELLARPLEIVRRRGVDQEPVDVADDEAVRVLEAFVWPDQDGRLERLRSAVRLARADPPEVVRGDFVELLPDLLPRNGLPTVVLTCMSTAYLGEERYQRFLATLGRLRRRRSLVWLSLEAPRHDRSWNAAALDLTVWPGGETRRLAAVDYHAAWLEWL
jgi:hypothetical protein